MDKFVTCAEPHGMLFFFFFVLVYKLLLLWGFVFLPLLASYKCIKILSLCFSLTFFSQYHEWKYSYPTLTRLLSKYLSKYCPNCLKILHFPTEGLQWRTSCVPVAFPREVRDLNWVSKLLLGVLPCWPSPFLFK